MFWRGLTKKQLILDTLCILMCIGALIYVLISYTKLPDRIPLNYDFDGKITGYGGKASIFVLLGVMYLMTGTFSVLLRLKVFYRHMNIPWTVPWGKQPLVIQATKDFLCWCNLCVTLDMTYLLISCIQGKILMVLVWIPYIILIPLLVWFLLRLRRICK